jgi:hypothetical protein
MRKTPMLASSNTYRGPSQDSQHFTTRRSSVAAQDSGTSQTSLKDRRQYVVTIAVQHNPRREHIAVVVNSVADRRQDVARLLVAAHVVRTVAAATLLLEQFAAEHPLAV